ncbi:MAG: TIGR04282 family arsenosugar biosynthesis glycosyltransferase, partial [Chitinophagaceae bacterium]
MKKALIIFIKNPVQGNVKTRVAKDLGDLVALEVYKKLLTYTHAITKGVAADRFVFYGDYVNENDIWEKFIFKKKLQSGLDLGERMHNAFAMVFDEGYQHAIIIGSDCLEISSEILEEAFMELEKRDAVIGPVSDGGYYLLGINEVIPQLFKNKIWSGINVFDDTTRDLAKSNLSYTILQELSDIDTA